MSGVSTIFLSELREELEFKKKEREQLMDQLALYDVRIDRYDAVIENMDRSLVGGLAEIDTAISNVQSAYDERISAGCRSDLAWVETGRVSVGLPGKYGSGSEQEFLVTYQVQKNATTAVDYGKTGVKYYRRPKNQDYGSNIVSEFFGSVSYGSSIIAIVGTSVAGTSGITIGDILTDDLENPVAFGADDLPTIVGFGETTIIIDTQMIGGSVTLGSTVIAAIGVGSTGNLGPGQSIIGTSILSPGTEIVDINTTTTEIELFDFDFGGFLTTSVTVPSIVVSTPALATTSINFAVGVTSTYSAYFLSTTADNTVEFTNFTAIRQTQSILDEFDPTNNPIDPVTIGIMNNSTLGFGHSVVRVSHPNLAPPGPFQWREVLEGYDPEPEVGGGTVSWNEGTTQWPQLITSTYSQSGLLLSQTRTYASEGDTVTIAIGSTLPTKVAIGYASTGPINPSFSGCSAKNSAISNAESVRDAALSKNAGTIDEVLAASLSLRKLRDQLEGQAFVFLQGRAAADAAIVRITKQIADLEAIDLSRFEPNTNTTKNKYTNNTVGVPTT